MTLDVAGKVALGIPLRDDELEALVERIRGLQKEVARLEEEKRDLVEQLEGEGPVLGRCSHGVDLDREFCPKGCRV